MLYAFVQICILHCHCIYCCEYGSKMCFLLQILQVGPSFVRRPPLRGAGGRGGVTPLRTGPTALSAPFILRVQILSAHFTGTQQAHFEELPASLRGPHGIPPGSSPALGLGLCVAFHTHAAFPNGARLAEPHMFCIKQATCFFSEGGGGFLLKASTGSLQHAG